MGPVRIKYWGIMGITRPTYVVLQSLAIVFCIVFIAVGFFGILLAGTVLPFRSGNWFIDVLIIMFWGGVVGLPAESMEMYIMLRKFARAEAEQHAKLAALDAGESAPSAPSSTAVTR